MNRRRRTLLILAVPLCCAAALVGVDLAGAQSGPPPVTLSPTSGPAGSSFTVALPAPCTVPSNHPTNPDALTVTMSYVDAFGIFGPGGTGVVSTQVYSGSPGVPLTSVLFAVPSGTPGGHFLVSATCSANSLPQAPTYGDAYFTVTGQTLPTITVNPTSAAPGSTVEVSGACSPGPGQPVSDLYVTVASSTDPNISFTSSIEGTGPILTVDVELLTSFVPGQYFIQATCNTYVTTTPIRRSTVDGHRDAVSDDSEHHVDEFLRCNRTIDLGELARYGLGHGHAERGEREQCHRIGHVLRVLKQPVQRLCGLGWLLRRTRL